MYNIAIVGAGMISYSHGNAANNIKNVNLAAICDIDEKKAKKFAKAFDCDYYTDLETMLKKRDDIEIVIVAVPTFLHEEIVSLCAKYNKHILCEKPLETSLEKSRRLIESVHKAGVIFMTAQVVRFWTGYSEIKRMYDAGELGEIYLVHAARCSILQSWDNSWLVNPKLGQGAILDMHVHDIDYLRYLLGPVDYVFCAAKKDKTECYNSVLSTLSFKNGSKALAQTSLNMQGNYPFTMSLQIIGTLATVEMKYRAGTTIGERNSIDSEIRIYKNGQDPIIKELEIYDGYTKQLEYFLDCVKRKVQPEKIPHSQNIEVMKIIDAIKKSAESEKIIHL